MVAMHAARIFGEPPTHASSESLDTPGGRDPENGNRRDGNMGSMWPSQILMAVVS